MFMIRRDSSNNLQPSSTHRSSRAADAACVMAKKSGTEILGSIHKPLLPDTLSAQNKYADANGEYGPQKLY